MALSEPFRYIGVLLYANPMQKPRVVLWLDTRRAVAGRFPVRVRVTFRVGDKWIQKYYGDKCYLTRAEFGTITNPRSETVREAASIIEPVFHKAKRIAAEPLTVDQFESRLFGKPLTSLESCFKDRIAFLSSVGRVSTKRSYAGALASILAFSQGADFPDITEDWLSRYEKTEKSVNTIGIYLRTLRAVFNHAIRSGLIPAEMYPFKNHSIRSERRFKVPLTAAQLQGIKDYEGQPAEMEAKDYFLFSYYCNGMNLGDVARLRRSDIQECFILYNRSKTHRTTVQNSKIVIPLDDRIQDIIRRRGAPTLDPNGFLFPILEAGLSEVTIKNRIGKFIKRINAGLKPIGKKVEKKITTVLARHTFANRMSNMGADRRMIQEALGHSVPATTEHYLGSIDVERMIKVREGL